MVLGLDGQDRKASSGRIWADSLPLASGCIRQFRYGPQMLWFCDLRLSRSCSQSPRLPCYRIGNKSASLLSCSRLPCYRIGNKSASLLPSSRLPCYRIGNKSASLLSSRVRALLASLVIVQMWPTFLPLTFRGNWRGMKRRLSAPSCVYTSVVPTCPADPYGNLAMIPKCYGFAISGKLAWNETSTVRFIYV